MDWEDVGGDYANMDYAFDGCINEGECRNCPLKGDCDIEELMRG